jgi:transketolase
MRKQLCDALISRSSDARMLFLTGDLGFMALEPLQEAMGHRFINAGVAEQNMVSVAAAMAREGFSPWVYSIAPFCYARPFEQIRNDVAFHKLPVKLIGNGGGYGYGVMGPTHHAIEDYGILLTLPNFRAYVPVFDEDIDALLQSAGDSPLPSYIRLGRGEVPKGYRVPQYAPWRQLTQGGGAVVIVAGPLAGTYIEGFQNLPEANRPNLWVVTELPIDSNPPPAQLVEQIAKVSKVCVVEEHVKRGGLGSEVALWLLEQNLNTKSFRHLFAKAHHYSTYGSQGFLRAKSGIDAKSVLALLSDSSSGF